MKKLATKLLVCSLVCSLLVNPVRAFAVDWEKLLGEMDTTEEKVSSVSVELGTSDLENIIEKAVANSVDKSVEKSIEKAALKVARDKKAVKNIVDESKKTSKGFALVRAFNAVRNSVFVVKLIALLSFIATYAFAPSSREAIKTDLNNLLNTLKNSNSANKVSELAKSAYAKTPEAFNSIVEKVKGLF